MSRALPKWVLDVMRETTAELVLDGMTPAEAMGVITLAMASVAGELMATALIPPGLKRPR